MQMRLMVDGDGSPVKEEVIRLGQRFQLPVIIITSVDHYTTKEYPPFVRLVYVDKGAVRADYQIVKEFLPGDILITQDYGLAAMVLSRGGDCINQNGNIITGENIDGMLNSRHINQKLRRQNIYTSKFKKRKNEANLYFEIGLKKLIEEA